MSSLTEVVRAIVAGDPHAAWLGRVFAQLEDVHWGAVRAPGSLIAGPGPRAVDLVDGTVTLPCVVETDTLLIAFEDARSAPLPTGTHADPRRHRVSQAIEALHVLARLRAREHQFPVDPLFGVIVVGGPDVPEPHRTTILEGLPHIAREQAEDLYAGYWGRLDPGRLAASAVAPPA